MDTHKKLIKKRNSEIIRSLLGVFIVFVPCYIVFPLINGIMYIQSLLKEFTVLNLVLAILCFTISSIFLYIAIRYFTKFNFRIVAYYSKKIGDSNVDTFINGQQIYKHIKYLDKICESENVKKITEFGFNDDFHSEKLHWHNPIDGLETLFAIKKYLIVNNCTNIVLIEELRKLEIGLKIAHLNSVNFSLLLRSDGCNSIEINKRQGSFW